MKTRTGLLRYDTMDTGGWCFDMEHEIIPIYPGTKVSLLSESECLDGELLESPDGDLYLVFDDRKTTQQFSRRLKPETRYLARISAATINTILNEAMLLDLKSHLEERSSPDNEGNDDDLCF